MTRRLKPKRRLKYPKGAKGRASMARRRQRRRSDEIARFIERWAAEMTRLYLLRLTSSILRRLRGEDGDLSQSSSGLASVRRPASGSNGGAA